MQALMLAAGMGRRLGKYTNNQTKCMVRVGGQTLLEHAVQALKQAGVQKLVLVVGYERERLKAFVSQHITGIEIEWVENPIFDTTNNIYSLYLAKDALIRDDTILLESDLIYDPSIIKDLVSYPADNVAVVAKYEPWMDGTVVRLNDKGDIAELIEKKDFSFDKAQGYYKTVNLYKFSRDFSLKEYVPFLSAYIEAYGTNQYYELVLKALAHAGQAKLKGMVLTHEPWYEIDDAQDLDIASALFAAPEDKLASLRDHQGGLWRFPGLIDFSHTVNPYFPTPKMLAQMKYSFDSLVCSSPSGIKVQKLLLEKMFQAPAGYLAAGNGAGQLIHTLCGLIKGKAGLMTPAYDGVKRCFKDEAVCEIPSWESGFAPDKERLIEMAGQVETLFIMNPDNPGGGFLGRKDMMELIDACRAHGTRLVVDETYGDFAEKQLRYTLMDENVLEANPHVVVVKSISKGRGVPGLPLGVMASGDARLMDSVQKALPSQNIGALSEYFMQIESLYAKDYEKACALMADNRAKFKKALEAIRFLKVYPSQGNYLLCQVNSPYTAQTLAARLVDRYQLLVKVLTGQPGMGGGEFIRLAIRDETDNGLLLNALEQLQNEG